MELQELKKNYNELAVKYKIPKFKEVDEDFEIAKIDKESDCILRVVRKTMMEKIVNSLGFMDMLFNPVNAPRIYLPYLKAMTLDDKQSMDKIYSALGELSLQSLELEVDYSEKKEAELIKKIYETWNSVKPEFRKILATMQKPNSQVKKEKTYFG